LQIHFGQAPQRLAAIFAEGHFDLGTLARGTKHRNFSVGMARGFRISGWHLSRGLIRKRAIHATNSLSTNELMPWAKFSLLQGGLNCPLWYR
jgi:hypothetical protein